MKEIALYKPHYYQGIPPVNLADPEYTVENIHLLTSVHESKKPLTSIEEVFKTMELVDKLYEKAQGHG